MKTFAKLILLLAVIIGLAWCQEDQGACNAQRQQAARQAAFEIFESDVSFLNNAFEESNNDNNNNSNADRQSKLQMLYQMVSSMDEMLESIQSVSSDNNNNNNNNVANQVDNILGRLNSSNSDGESNSFLMRRIVDRLETMRGRLQSNSADGNNNSNGNNNNNNNNNNSFADFGRNDCEKLLSAALDGLRANARYLNQGLSLFNVMLLRNNVNDNTSQEKINKVISLTENFVGNMHQGLSDTIEAGEFNSTFGLNRNKLSVLEQSLLQSERVVRQLEGRVDSDQDFEQIKSDLVAMKQSIESVINSDQHLPDNNQFNQSDDTNNLL